MFRCWVMENVTYINTLCIVAIDAGHHVGHTCKNQNILLILTVSKDLLLPPSRSVQETTTYQGSATDLTNENSTHQIAEQASTSVVRQLLLSVLVESLTCTRKFVVIKYKQ